jgi:tRNA (guanine37-N1)-methyltransferase
VIDAVTAAAGRAGRRTGRTTRTGGLLEYPHYTRPPEFRGWAVPEVLLSGDHAKIEKWRREQSLLRTLQRRPDLLEKAQLSEADRKFLEKHLATENTGKKKEPRIKKHRAN